MKETMQKFKLRDYQRINLEGTMKKEHLDLQKALKQEQADGNNPIIALHHEQKMSPKIMM